MKKDLMMWKANPHSYGVIYLYIEGRKSSVGGISDVEGRVKGYLFEDEVYDGEDKDKAIKEVEFSYRVLPEGVKKALKD